MEITMEERKNIQEELEQHSPLLARLKQSESRLMNDDPGMDYFQSLPDEVLRRARAEESLYGNRLSTETVERNIPSSWWAQLASNWKQWSVSLAALLLIAFFAYQLMPTSTTDAPVVAQLEDLESETIDDYINNNISEFELELFIEADITEDAIVSEVLSNDLLDETLDQYLEDILDEVDLDDLQDVL